MLNFKIVSGRLDFLVLFDQVKRMLFVLDYFKSMNRYNDRFHQMIEIRINHGAVNGLSDFLKAETLSA